MEQLNLLKLSVGTSTVEDLAEWQHSQRAHWPKDTAVHVTRMWPKRAPEVLNGGSIYWVIKGLILCRQRVIGLEQVTGADGIARCAMLLDTTLIRTESAPRRPFQGWRYLDPKDAPRDLPQGRATEEALPHALAQALAEIGLR